MKKGLILCIIGASGAGKTTVESVLAKICVKGYHPFRPIVSYTTRPMRNDETDRVQHHFVTPADNPTDRSHILACTEYGGYDYWALTDSVQPGVVNTYVVDVEGYNYLVQHHIEIYDIRVLYVKRPNRTDIDPERLQRDIGLQSLHADDVDIVIRNDSSKQELEAVTRHHAADIIGVFL